MNRPMTASCNQVDLEKQIVFRANRLSRVRNVRCLRLMDLSTGFANGMNSSLNMV